jgi:hypothetical protein
MNKKPLFVIRGTGIDSLDGTLVQIEEGADDHCKIRPFNRTDVAFGSVKVHKKYLVPVRKNVNTYKYKITIVIEDETLGGEKSVTRTIGDAYRKINIEELADKLEQDLIPIVRKG